MTKVTHILNGIDAGDPHPAAQLLPLVYDALRQLAAQRLAQEKPGQTLEATALVHEAYLRLMTRSRSPPSEGGERPSKSPPSEGGEREGVHWNGRNHFFAAAAEAMRRILVENARRKQGPKHGGRLRRIDADLDLVAAQAPSVDLIALDEALTRLAKESPARAALVKLRFFAGLTVSEAAEVLGISLATAERYWTYARTWLYAELSGADDSPPSA